MADKPVPQGISLDRVRRQIVLEPSVLAQYLVQYQGLAGTLAVSVGFDATPDLPQMRHRLTPDPEGPPGQGGVVRRSVHILCPAHSGLSDQVILTLHSTTEPQQITLRPGDLPDTAMPVLRVGTPRFAALRGRLHLSGWGHHPTPPDRIVLLSEPEGAQIGTGYLGLPRKAVVGRNPFLAADCGWRIDAILAPALLHGLISGTSRLVIETRARDDTLLARTPLPDIDSLLRDSLTPAVQQQTRALQRAIQKAQQASTAKLRWLLASEAFRRRWDGLQNDPQDNLGWLIRAAVADALATRLQSGDEVSLRLAGGDLVLCQPMDDSVLARRFLFSAGDERGFLDWLHHWTRTRVQPGATVIDVGAAYGVVSRTMARAGACVIAIEADPLSAGRIRRSQMQFDPGQTGGGHITLIEAAISDRPGTVVFAGMGGSTIGAGKIIASDTAETVAAFLAEISDLGQVGFSSQVAGAQGQAEQHQRRVFGPQDVNILHLAATTLDHICAERSLRDVALVKIDIEGGELLALRGAAGLLDGAFGVPPVVAFEYSALFPTRGGPREDILDLFFDRGWKIYRLAQGKNGGGDLIPVTTHAEAPQHDNLVAIPPGRS